MLLATQGSPAQAAAERLLERQRDQGSEALRRSVERLDPAERENLVSVLGQATFNELIALGEEGDAELFFSGLFQLTARAQRNRNAAWAAFVYQGMSQAEGAFAAIPSQSRNRAREELEVLQGGGSFGRRFENFSTNLIREATDPSMIIGMGVGGIAFSAVRMGVLARFAARPASWLTRGLGARFLASSLALPAEVLGFWGTGRAVTAIAHPGTLRWDGETLRHELASQFLTLGLLKVSGAATSHLFDRFHGISALTGEAARLPAFTQFSRGAFHQIGMFGGIAASHYAEVRFGLRPDSGHFWSDSLATLISFNVGGRVAQTVLGPGHAARVQALEMQTQAIGRTAPPSTGESGFGLETLGLTPEGLAMPIPSEAPKGPEILMMSGGESGKGPRRGGGVGGRPPVEASGNAPESHPWNLAGACKTTLRILMDPEIPITERFQRSRWLYEHMDLARSTYEKLYQSDLDGGRGRDNGSSWRTFDILLHSINRRHFETLSDTLFEWNKRFSFLQGELRNRFNVGTQRQRREVGRLLDSVDLKYLETRRYLNDAESYLGDDKGHGEGTRSKSEFAAANYDRLIQRFLDINSRLERYVQSKPELERLFKSYRQNRIERHFPSVGSEEMSRAIRGAGLGAGIERRLNEAFEREDHFFEGQGRASLFRMLGSWASEPDAKIAARGRQALERYLDVVEGLHRNLDDSERQQWSEAHDEIVGDRLVTDAMRTRLSRILDRSHENAEEAVGEYFAAARSLQTLLSNHRPQPLPPTAPEWAELRQQFRRLGDRKILSMSTVDGLLRWFEPPQNQRSSSAIFNMRQDTAAGLIDFLRKGSHSDQDRRAIANFLGEVVARNDRGMLGVLSIYFQNYQLGMMRDRFQIRSRPSTDNISDQMAKEAYDQFLEAFRNTARFYGENRELRGPYFEVFLKLERGNDDSNALLAAPILHQTQRLIDVGFSVELLGRGGSGEGILYARGANGRNLTTTVSSIRDELVSRAHLEHWLDRAERELLHNGDYQRRRNGKERLVVALQIPRIKSGVKRENLQVWARDYLEAHPNLAEIQLIIPEKGNAVLNPLDPTFFQTALVTREMPTTESILASRLEALNRPDTTWQDYSPVLRMRREWADHLLGNDEDLRRSFRFPDPVLYWENRLRLVQASLSPANSSSAAGEEPAPPSTNGDSGERRLARAQGLLDAAQRVQNLRQANWDLVSSLSSRFLDDKAYLRTVQDMWTERANVFETYGWNDLSERGSAEQSKELPYPSVERRREWFREAARMLTGIEFPANRLGDLLDMSLVGYRADSLNWKFREKSLTLNGDLIPSPTALAVAERSGRERIVGEPDLGTFSIGLSRERRGARQLQLAALTLSNHLRGQGVGTYYFGELIRLGGNLGVDSIASPETSGDHRYTMAIYGMRFRDDQERRRILAPFEVSVTSHIMKSPAWAGYDTSALSQIRTLAHIASAHFDPGAKRLVLGPWRPGGITGNGPEVLPETHQIGRHYLLTEARSYNANFDLDPDSYSIRTFYEYVRRRFPTGVPREEEN